MTSGEKLSPLQATSAPHNGNIGCVRPRATTITSSSNGSSIQNSTTNFANAISGSDNIGDVGNETNTCQVSTSAAAAVNTNSNGVWPGLRTCLFSTAALIADEHGDPLAATQ